ncbi:MAG TPA: hypothetical protein PKV95_06565 [Anaerolineaceae bacterium]|jgi:hypothetical protein|nr:hypothetical protein [Anaerolineaceae bacterium]HNS63299.1 hypothetical protein [Anaerolineaceae bacterium]HNZ01703.1 hypothetical protein [Anaerolineaceae bacterium]HOD43640.1 hypothetical protein [Anaerolineaceae bacterium]HOH20835.1 hypothetical protein [Anaerolineaceae bacterium]
MFEFLESIFGSSPYPSQNREEVQRLLGELLRIGTTDDYLSERPGSPFNSQCRHTRAREIGKRFHEIGGLRLMEWAHQRVRRKLGPALASHLEYAWAEIGEWMS